MNVTCHLKNWSVVGESRLCGKVRNHPEFEDGTEVNCF